MGFLAFHHLTSSATVDWCPGLLLSPVSLVLYWLTSPAFFTTLPVKLSSFTLLVFFFTSSYFFDTVKIRNPYFKHAKSL